MTGLFIVLLFIVITIVESVNLYHCFINKRLKMGVKISHFLFLDEKKMENFGRQFENLRHFADKSIFELVKKSGKKN